MFADELILEVDNLAASTQFYRALLGRDALQSRPAQSRFALNAATTLVLREGAAARPELALRLRARAALEAEHALWLDEGFPVRQAPTRDAGAYSACTVDPDGHRLRFYVPARSWPSR